MFEGERASQVDMPQFLKALERHVAHVCEIRKGCVNAADLVDAIRNHVRLVKMQLEIYGSHADLRRRAAIQGLGLEALFQDLFGRESLVTAHVRDMAEGLHTPEKAAKDQDITGRLLDQIQALKALESQVPDCSNMAEVLEEEIRILIKLPSVFPEGSAARDGLARRIAPLAHDT